MKDDAEAVISQHDVAEGSVKSYVIGFLLSIVLTIIPFALVVNGDLSRTLIIFLLIGFALVQLIVQLVFFLHLGRGSSARWNIIMFLFMALVVGIVVAGSLWIMYHLDYNMMPKQDIDTHMIQEAQKGF